jgi:ubiquinone biosynthesis protein
MWNYLKEYFNIYKSLLKNVFVRPVFYRLYRTGWAGLSVDEKGEIGKNVYRFLNDLGPFYQKIGQILGSNKDYIADEIRQELLQLQEENWDGLLSRQEIDDLIGKYLESGDIRDFDYKPFASGTVAQIHHATDAANRKLAIKIVKSGARQRFFYNMAVLSQIADFFGKRYHVLTKILSSLKYISKYVIDQCDLRVEHNNIKKFADYNEYGLQKHNIHLPKVLNQNDPDVMIMEFIEGQTGTNLDWNSIDYDTKFRLVKKIFFVCLDSSINEGFYHLDLHPGNVIINFKDDKLHLIDFGLMGQSSLLVKRYFGGLIGFISEKPVRFGELCRLDCKYQFDFEYPTGDPTFNEVFLESYRDYIEKGVLNSKLDLVNYNRCRKTLMDKYNLVIVPRENPFSVALFCVTSLIDQIDPSIKISDFL